MRGKITIVVLLVGSALFYWYAFWYFNSVSSADIRFNLLRKPITNDMNDVALFPVAVGDFRLQGAPSTQTGEVITETVDYAAVSDKPLHFTVRKFADATTAKQFNDSYKECISVPHADAKVPYVYYECKEGQSSSAPTKYAFTWINGLYRFDASATDVEQLVRFVNGYPY
jgi:hypothetical protein